MNFSSVLNRYHQFWHALLARPMTEVNLAQVQAILTPEQMTLFSRLQLSEQTHSLRVLKTLKTGGESHPDLFIAALLHDIGKIRYPLCLWQRVFIVLAKAIWPDRVEAYGKNKPQGWQLPFVVAAQHPAWGANLALEAGVSPLAGNLIRKHQESISSGINLESQLLIALRNADRQY